MVKWGKREGWDVKLQRPAALGLALGCLLSVPAGAMPAPMAWYPPTPAVLPLLLEGEVSIHGGEIVVDAPHGMLTYTLELVNDTPDTQQGLVAVPFLASARWLDQELRTGITLDGAAVPAAYRFAPSPSLPWDQETDAMELWCGVTMGPSLDALETSGPNLLRSLDEDAPLSGYLVRIESAVDGYVKLELDYDPERTKVLLDLGGEGYVIGDPGLNANHTAYAQLDLEEGEVRECGVYLVGEDTISFQVDRPEVQTETRAVSGVDLLGLLGSYIHTYDEERSAALAGMDRELALRYIDSQLQTGASLLDLSSLAYDAGTASFLSACLVQVPLAPGESRTLQVRQPLHIGLDATDRDAPAERMAVVMTEPLKRWPKVGAVQIEVQAERLAKDLRAVPAMEAQGGRRYTAVLEGAAGGNLYFGQLGDFKVEGRGWGNVLIILGMVALRIWPVWITPLVVAIYLLYRLVKRIRSSRGSGS